MHVSSVYFLVFQMFETYVVIVSYGCCKVDLDVVYVAMVIHICFKSIFQVFDLLQMYVANVSSVCFKSRSGVTHVAMDAGGYRTAAYRSRMVILLGCRRG
jgi:cellulose synthase/poly-beta-1,6-N-acetylglucosamine synthase-like glycosyltransferase